MTTHEPERAPSTGDVLVTGAVVAYRLHDVGYAIDLEHAERLAAATVTDSSPSRVRPVRLDARAIHIENPPLAIALGAHPVRVDGIETAAMLSARLFDFGVCAMQLEIPLPPRTSWDAFARVAAAFDRPDVAPELGALLDTALTSLRARVEPAIERPRLAPVQEDYVVFRVSALHDAAGRAIAANDLDDELLVPLLVGERRALSPSATRDLLQHRFSYYADDLTILTWDNALVVEPRASDRDVEYILEFANALLLELRVYDDLLDDELPALYDRVEAARGRRRFRLPGRGFAHILSRVQGFVADVTETVERAENAVKVTEDVYLARVYDAALRLFRAPAWRRGIERKLAIFRETYAMLNDEAQATRAEILEILILAVIVAELFLALMGLY